MKNEENTEAKTNTEAGKDRAQRLVSPNWHKITESIPPYRHRVILKQTNGFISIAWRTMDRWKKEQWLTGQSRICKDTVEMWCEIPPFPTED
jgi:hypothetical protein